MSRTLCLACLAFSLLVANAGAQYSVGYVWNRQTQWATTGQIANRNWMAGNPARDSIGSLVWAMEYVVGGQGLDGDAAQHWYVQQPNLMVWDDQYFAGSASWVVADNVPAQIGPNFHHHRRSVAHWGNVPMIRWINPGLHDVRMEISGSLQVVWGGEQPGNLCATVDVVIARKRGSAVTLLLAQTIQKTGSCTVEESALVTISPPIQVTLSAGDEILITHRNRAPDQTVGTFAYTNLLDSALNLTIVAGTPSECRIVDTNGDGVINFTDLSRVISFTGQTCD